MKTLPFFSMIRFSGFFLFLVISFGLLAQSPAGAQRGAGGGELPRIGTVTGKVVDANTGDPLMFASLVLHSQRDSSMVTGAISNESGHFVIEQVPPGSFYLSVNYVGYPRKQVNGIHITFRETVYDMGEIQVEPGAALLEEVTVAAARQLMEVGLDRRVINVDQELTASGGSALEVMRNIPSVAVDFDGNVSLRGSSNVTILIDGRPSALTGLSGSESLEQIPASMIERIEVITNPSVRYDPDGTSGMINVVLKKEKRPGYNGMISLNASTGNRYTGSLNLNYKINDVNLFANFSGRFFNMEGSGFNFRTSFLADTTFLDQNSSFDNNMNSQNIQVGADYTINKHNTITGSMRYNTWNRGGSNFTDYNMLYSDYSLYNYFTRTSDNEFTNNGLSYNLNYRRTFEQRFRELNADLSFSHRTNTREERMVQQPFDTSKEPLADGFQMLENTFSDGNNWMVSAQFDYVHPLGQDRKLETGFRATLREMDNDFNFFNFDHEKQSWENNLGLSNHFVYNEQVYAVYGIFSTMLGKYSVQTGLRAEQAFTRADQRTTSAMYENDYISLFPSLHVRRNMENNQSMQVSYSRRINRPNNRFLNPFVSYSDPYDLSFGNPHLDPEYIHSAELGYTRFWGRTTVNPSIFYRHTEGMITRFRTMDEDGIAYTTFQNLRTGKSYGAELILGQQVASFWRANGTFSYFRQVVEGGGDAMEMANRSNSWSARLVNNFDFGNGWSAQLNGFYRSPVVLIQGEMREMYSADIGVRKNVLQNRGSINLRLSDIFNTQRFGMYNFGDNFTMTSERRRNSRMIFVGFTYRINEYDQRSRRNRGASDMDNGSMDFDDFD
jgi:outer membrane cobalamin receptor